MVVCKLYLVGGILLANIAYVFFELEFDLINFLKELIDLWVQPRFRPRSPPIMLYLPPLDVILELRQNCCVIVKEAIRGLQDCPQLLLCFRWRRDFRILVWIFWLISFSMFFGRILRLVRRILLLL